MVQGDRHLSYRSQALGSEQLLLRCGESLAELPSPAHSLENLGQKLGQGCILGQVVVGAMTEGGRRKGLVPMAGDDDDRGSGRPGTDRIEYV